MGVIQPLTGCLEKSVLDELGTIIDDSEVTSSDWICEGCFKSATYKDNGRKTHKFASTREEALDYTLKSLQEDGACLARRAMEKYKELMNMNYDMHDIPKLIVSV